ncbi:hypothetical protein BrevBR_13550 [Brevundimonas sp. BR2-1]|uniref:hypothetical protein n=1 Tax=unclassified Brevundimonas TaxID=2622653 RepID=UPI002FCAFAD0
MIVWSGWGFLVAVFYVVGFVVGIPVGGLVSADPNTATAVSFVFAGLLAGLGSFLLARQIEKGEGRAFIDEATQQRIVVRKHAGSLFFIPTRYWAYAAPLLGIGLAVLMLTTPPVDPAGPAPVEMAAPAVAEPVVASTGEQPT